MYLCHADGEDDSVIRMIYCHMTGLGVSVVNAKEKYDLNSAITKEKYVVIVLSDLLCLDVNKLYELNVIKHLFHLKRIKLFTIYRKENCVTIPKRMKWLLDSDLHVIQQLDDIHTVVYKVIDCILQDRQKGATNYDMESLISKAPLSSDLFIEEMKRMYHELNEDDVRARLIVIYSIYAYIDKIFRIPIQNLFYYKFVSYFIQYSGECMPVSARQIKVVEKCLALAYLESCAS